MPRSISGGERALLSGRYDLHLKVEAANADGSWIDVSTWVETVDIENDLDNGAARCTITLARESGQGGTASLAPFLSTSLLNRNNAGTYAPLLNPNRAIRVSTAPVIAGTGPAGFHVDFNGITDDVNWGQSPLKVECRDAVKRLLNAQIEAVRTYGANPTVGPPATFGIDVETVMQSIINDNVANPPALVLGPTGTPSWLLDEYAQDEVKVYEALRALAMQIGWDVRMRWSGASELLTLYKPDRTKTVPDWTLGPSEYLSIPSLSINDDTVRNWIDVVYVDSITHLPTTITVTDPASIAAFDKQYMRLAGDATSSIVLAADAQRMADAALSDLAFPRAAQDIETTFLWPIELGDLIRFSANAIHYDSAQDLAVASYHHHLEHGSGTTTIRTSGKPAGAYAAWLKLGSGGGSGGVLPLIPELFPNTPKEVMAAGVDGTYAVVGWSISGRVDEDTNAVIVTLSASLAIRDTAPAYTTVSNPPATEYWLNVVPGGTFTVAVYLTAGGSGQVTLVPASVHNPTDAIPPPRGGLLGTPYVQTLSRTPVTSINTTQPTLTSFAVTLSVRPIDATIKYRFAPDALVGTEPWVAVQDPSGATTFLVDVSGAPVMLEYASVSTDWIAEEIHHMRLDQGTVPLISNLTLVELTPNVLTASWTINDNVVSWELYAKRAGFPDLAAGVPDPAYLRFTGNRQRTEVSFYAAGTGLVSPDHWQVLVIGYDGYGARSPWAAGSCIVQGTVGTPPAVGALSGLLAVVVNEAGTDYVDVTWVNNAVIEAAAPSRFSVAIVRDDGGLGASAWPAQTDHLGSGTIPGVGGWHHTCTPAAAGASGASLLTLGYTVSLYDIATLVATYTTSVTGWFYVAGLGVPPSGTPTLPVVTVGFPTTITLQANWTGLGLDPTLELEIDWHSSTDSFAVDDQVFLSEILAPNTQVHSARGFIAGQSGRARIRYLNAFGVGPWTAWSNTVASGGPPLP